MACSALLANQKALLVRPEDVEVGAVAPGWGNAVVTRRSFLGGQLQLTLQSIEGTKNTLTLTADVSRDHTAQVGDMVGIRIAPGRLMASNDGHWTSLLSCCS